MILKTGNGYDFIISDEDYEFISQFNTCYDRSHGYISITHNGKKTYLHRLLLNAKKGEMVDHINTNTIDLRRENLRLVSKSLNNYNKRNKHTSDNFGIYFDKCGNRYRPCVSYNNKTLKLGSFDNVIDAKIAYNKKNIELYGDAAILHTL